METIYVTAAVWLALAVLSSILAAHLRLSMALAEICVGIAAGELARHFIGGDVLAVNQDWLKFLAGIGAILLTFLAGAELEYQVVKAKFREIFVVGLIGFFAPFLGCAAVARILLHWSPQASLLAGVALSTTSMAVVYAVMLETGLNKTEYGKAILGACFVNDLGTVIALGLLFSPFGVRTIVFVAAVLVFLYLLPRATRAITTRYGNKTAAIRTKWIITVLLSLGASAIWAGSEAVLPAYLIGMTLAGVMGEDSHFVRRIRTLTIGFLTPFYFIRAGTLVEARFMIAAPLVILALFGGKVLFKIVGLKPVISLFRRDHREKWYYTLLMSTGLTFGTISALFGLSKGIINTQQYSLLVIVVIGSAIFPTLIANIFFFPAHLKGRVPTPDDEVMPSNEDWNSNDIR